MMAGLLDNYQQGGLLGGQGFSGLSPMLLAAGAGLLGGQGYGGAINNAMQAQQAQQQNALKNLMLRHSLQKDERDYNLRREQFDFTKQNAGATQHTRDLDRVNADRKAAGQPPLSMEQWIAQQRAGAGEAFGTVIWGTGPDGKPTVFQPTKSGELRPSKMPEGYSVGKDALKIDTPTEVIVLDPVTRQPIARYPKDIAGAAARQKEGAALGEAKADLASIKSKMPGLESVVRQLDDLSNKATYTAAGQVIDFAARQAGLEPRDAAVARAQYIAMVDNQILPMLRDTFGAQFTQKEGESLKITLGDPNKSPAEKQAVLKAFIEQKRRNIEAAEARTGVVPGGGGWSVQEIK